MTNDEQPPDDTELVIRVMAVPADTNIAGDIVGGWIMSQIDIAGSIIARRYAQGRVVTVAVNSFLFKQPVFVGDLVSCYAKVTKIGHTSITVHVRAFAERYGKHHECPQVTQADVTYVAVDGNRKPRAVPKKV